MLDLAINSNNEYIPLKDIAKRQNISDKYLEQIITQLTKAGFVKSTRGSQGGYMLNGNPSKYSVGMVLRLVEGNLAPVYCVECEDNICERKEECVTVEVWQSIKDAVDKVVDNITLEDLVKRHHEKAKTAV